MADRVTQHAPFARLSSVPSELLLIFVDTLKALSVSPCFSLGLFLVASQPLGIILPLYGVCHDFPSVALTPWLTECLEWYPSPSALQV